MTTETPTPPSLLRALTLPWLVFYGLGVTIGAGIFALIGEILALAGDAAPAAFLLAGLIASVTGVSYAVLVSVFPKAGGDAVFVTRGMGPLLGRIAGIGVVATGIISSAVIALAFAGYARTLVPLPDWAMVPAVIAVLTAFACWGVRESVAFASVITLLELGTLVVVVVAGLPYFSNLPPVPAMAGFGAGSAGLAAVLGGAIIAFFAFIGFEDIENMVEETVDPVRTAPRAIVWTLGVTVIVYLLLALVAVGAPQRDLIAGSQAPLAILFEQVTGTGRAPVAAMAAIAMVNGILVQILMAARTLFGMANEGLIPAWFGRVHRSRRTPVRATLAVAALILVLALSFPLVSLAETTSFVVLAVFCLVNLSLFFLGRSGNHPTLVRWRWWGLAGAIVSAAIPALQLWMGYA